MKIDGEWEAMHMEKFASGANYQVGELPYPADRVELKNTAWADGDIMVEPVGCKNPDLAWEFMRWMQEPAQQVVYAPLMNNLPSILSLQNSPALTRGSNSRRVLGYVLKHIASNAKNTHYFPAMPAADIYRDTLKTSVEKALFHVLTPKQALDFVQARVEQELRR